METVKFYLNDAEVAECFNEYFCNFTDNLDIDPIFKEVQEDLSEKQMILRAINKYKDHPSIRVINQHALPNAKVFQFFYVDPTEVMRQRDLLGTTKSNCGCIPPSTLKVMQKLVCL